MVEQVVLLPYSSSIPGCILSSGYCPCEGLLCVFPPHAQRSQDRLQIHCNPDWDWCGERSEVSVLFYPK